MANPVLHIKDSYYFEVPKVLYPANFKSLNDFPIVWVSLDPEFQEWEFERLYEELEKVRDDGAPLLLYGKDLYHKSWHEWVESDHANHGKPFDVFIEEAHDAHVAAWQNWKKDRLAQAEAAKDTEAIRLTNTVDFRSYINAAGIDALPPHAELLSITRWLHEVKAHSTRQIGGNEWDQMRRRAGNVEEYKREFETGAVPDWDKPKIDGYNHHLSGKILIPQVFGGELRNLYEKEPGLTNIAISKFMIVQVVVGLILIGVFG